jgi:hypothetical protein
VGGAALGDRFVALLGVPDGHGWMPAAELFEAGWRRCSRRWGRRGAPTAQLVAGTLLVAQYAQRLVAHREPGPGPAVLQRVPGAAARDDTGAVRPRHRRGHRPFPANLTVVHARMEA